MTAKSIVYGADARDAALAGVETLAKAVKATLGPRGRYALIGKQWGAPSATKDGVSVANEITLSDPYANVGARLVREVASRTAEMAGDGTTTATVLAASIYREGLKNVAAGADPMALKRGMDEAVGRVVKELARISRPVDGREDIRNVATISANGDESIGEMLADAMERVGKDGSITIEEAKAMETTVEVVEGLQFDRGTLSPYFITDAERMECVLEDALVLLHEKKISSMKALLPLLEKVAQGGSPLLVVCEDVEGEALATLVVNNLRGNLKCCAVKAPGFGERRKTMLHDLAVVTGGKVVSEELGVKLENMELSDLGRARRIVVDKDTTTLIEGAADKSAIEGRCAEIRVQIDRTTANYEREKLEERLAKLSGGVAVIRVGAATETEMKEKKDLVDDALHATRAAVEEGILPGGGVSFIRAMSVLDSMDSRGDEATGASIIRRALETPLREIVANAGLEGAVVIDRVKSHEGAWGFDAARLTYCDLLEAGIVDPTKVARTALQNAASIAGLLLTTEAMIIDAPARGRANTRSFDDGFDD